LGLDPAWLQLSAPSINCRTQLVEPARIEGHYRRP
jgi:hypothetical protein